MSDSPASKPAPRLIRVPNDAEAAAIEWLRYFGYVDAEMFPAAGPDGGVDVRATGLIGQVKAQVQPVGRPIVQQTYGIAAAEGATAVVFSLGGFTDEAIEWADKHGVARFEFDLSGEPQAKNEAAMRIAAHTPSLADVHEQWKNLDRCEQAASTQIGEARVALGMPDLGAFGPYVRASYDGLFDPAKQKQEAVEAVDEYNAAAKAFVAIAELFLASDPPDDEREKAQRLMEWAQDGWDRIVKEAREAGKPL